MQTRLSDTLKNTSRGREADAILRRCVHCGFCNAACPTYRLLGDELDGPRGRIYLIKRMFEGEGTGRGTQLHLDRCLTCRACETSCPSGVEYGRLLDLGREQLEYQVTRPWGERLARRLLRILLPYPGRLRPLLVVARCVAVLLPQRLTRLLPPARNGVSSTARPPPRHARRMVLLEGCVQSITHPAINAATARVLDRLGITLVSVPQAGCCGTLSHHLAAPEEGRAFMRRNIDAWWPHVEAGAEAIVMTASACALMVKDYGRLLRDDPRYAAKAARISLLSRDIAEVLSAEDLTSLPRTPSSGRIACHVPCTLQHGQGLSGLMEGLLRGAGFELTAVADGALCCGAGGAYALFQPALAGRLRETKLAELGRGAPACIVTGNIGCLIHLQSASSVPVRHWIELLDDSLS